MRRFQRLAWRWLLALLVLLPFGSGIVPVEGNADHEREEPARAFAKLEAGMSPEQVRQLVGAPPLIARQILYHRYREQWIYDAPRTTRLTFECLRGQKPFLTTDFTDNTDKKK